MPTITLPTGVDLPHDIYSSHVEGFRGVRVEPARTGFLEGREFRAFKEFSIPANNTFVIKVIVPIDIILSDVSLVLDDGSVRMSTVALGTEGGTFVNDLSIFGKNRMLSRPTPYYVGQVTASSGGTHTGGVVIDVIRVVAAGATAQRSSVGSASFDERGVSPGTYYFRLENIGSGVATGTFSGFWEERLPS